MDISTETIKLTGEQHQAVIDALIALNRGSICILDGATEMGKTQALQQMGLHPSLITPYLVDAKDGMTFSELMQAFFDVMAPDQELTGSIAEQLGQFQSVLRDHNSAKPAALLVDHCERATLDALVTLLSVRETSFRQIPILLIGNGIYEKIEGEGAIDMAQVERITLHGLSYDGAADWLISQHNLRADEMADLLPLDTGKRHAPKALLESLTSWNDLKAKFLHNQISNKPHLRVNLSGLQRFTRMPTVRYSAATGLAAFLAISLVNNVQFDTSASSKVLANYADSSGEPNLMLMAYPLSAAHASIRATQEKSTPKVESTRKVVTQKPVASVERTVPEQKKPEAAPQKDTAKVTKSTPKPPSQLSDWKRQSEQVFATAEKGSYTAQFFSVKDDIYAGKFLKNESIEDVHYLVKNGWHIFASAPQATKDDALKIGIELSEKYNWGAPWVRKVSALL